MNTPIKLINPLSDHPTEMWLQAITDFEETLDTPGYEIDMGYWCERRKKPIARPVCSVCMAGASMVRRSQGLPDEVFLDIFSKQDRRKFESINDMRQGHFWDALSLLTLEEQDHKRWIEATRAADLEEIPRSIRDANKTHDWPRLIKLLREAIARIDAEYTRLHETTPHEA